MESNIGVCVTVCVRCDHETEEVSESVAAVEAELNRQQLLYQTLQSKLQELEHERAQAESSKALVCTLTLCGSHQLCCVSLARE